MTTYTMASFQRNGFIGNSTCSVSLVYIILFLEDTEGFFIIQVLLKMIVRKINFKQIDTILKYFAQALQKKSNH